EPSPRSSSRPSIWRSWGSPGDRGRVGLWPHSVQNPVPPGSARRQERGRHEALPDGRGLASRDGGAGALGRGGSAGGARPSHGPARGGGATGPRVQPVREGVVL